MSVSLRDLDRRVDALPPTHFDAADLMRQGEARLRRRRRAAVAAVTLAVVAVVGGAWFASSSTRNAASDAPPAEHRHTAPDDKTRDDGQAETRLVQRLLTYAEGSTIHWGDRTIDVGQTVQAVHATDDGVVFVRGDKAACPYGIACRTLWFTDGAEPVRIGAATGSWLRGFGVVFAVTGSTVVWSEPDPGDHASQYPEPVEYVAYDTSSRREVGRFGSKRSEILAVGADTVFWVPDGRQCVGFDGACVRYTDPVMRFDVGTGQQTAVTWASYWAEHKTWPRTLVVPPHARESADGRIVRPRHADPQLVDDYGFQLVGDRLRGDDRGVEVTVRLASTEEPLRLRMPAGYPSGSFFGFTQWLDDDHVVMWAEDGALLVCQLPDGLCQTTVRHGGITGFGGRG